MSGERFVCPVCGFAGLHEPARGATGQGSDERCPSCGFQFNFHDTDLGISDEQWRAEWVAAGMSWRSRGLTPPTGWNPAAQLATVTGIDSLREASGRDGHTAPSPWPPRRADTGLDAPPNRAFVCPVCGFPDLPDEPRGTDGRWSHEYCPSCGFQFGYHDADQGISDAQWREKWVAEGMPWRIPEWPRPEGWDPAAQLAALLHTD